jgi:hypothetical protein
MQISIKSDILRILPKLDRFTKRHAPTIVSGALNQTAKQVQIDVREAIQTVFDRPTPYTVRSTFLRPATKARLEAHVGIKDEAVKGIAPIKYLAAQIYGGSRNDKRSEKLLRSFGILADGYSIVPGQGLKLDRYGNISRGIIQRILSQLKANHDSYANETVASRKRKRATAQPQARYFAIPVGSNTSRLAPGIYARFGFSSGSAIKPILMFVKTPRYKARLHFHDIGMKAINANLERNLRKAYEIAIATAR